MPFIARPVSRCKGCTKKMRLALVTIRLAALIVLLASASDYWAYDRWDPAAPMNSSGPEAISLFASRAASTLSLHRANLPDDHCLCCSPFGCASDPRSPSPWLQFIRRGARLRYRSNRMEDPPRERPSSITRSHRVRPSAAGIAVPSTLFLPGSN